MKCEKCGKELEEGEVCECCASEGEPVVEDEPEVVEEQPAEESAEEAVPEATEESAEAADESPDEQSEPVSDIVLEGEDNTYDEYAAPEEKPQKKGIVARIKSALGMK